MAVCRKGGRQGDEMEGRRVLRRVLEVRLGGRRQTRTLECLLLPLSLLLVGKTRGWAVKKEPYF